ncbi:hypothetical protein D7V21_14580 [Acinetobacter guerrae]|uniref:Lipoprotein n=1 Tax=Acinetobacter guerrae TaxID=1843371 RepID=A0A3A8EQI5_9GAMM|nr:hypothetical protein [Acinetobacter guerrae]RKG31141.1 hypothetical protein D7V21_14580 [Acinetobacter guerrae]
MTFFSARYLLISGMLITILGLLQGCDQPSPSNTQENTSSDHETKVQVTDQDVVNTPSSDFKSGNFFYIARDVADLQLRAGDYIQQLKQSQTELQQAIREKDSDQLQQTATTLQQQLKGFDQALNSLNLKSQEIEDIRKKLLESNQQVLKSPFLNGQVNWDQVNFKQIEHQMNNIQGEMLKLATMMIPQSDSSSSKSSNPNETSS